MFDSISSALEKMIKSFSADRFQYLVYLGISLVVVSLTIVLSFSEDRVFQRFLGDIDPLAAVLAAVVGGFILLSFLLSKRWFVIFARENVSGYFHLLGLAGVLGVMMIIVDTRIQFPADLNILFPQSLLFYPAIAFFVEIFFHVFPLTLLVAGMSAILQNLNFNTVVWISIVVISIAEPVYHTVSMASMGHFPFWAVVYVAFHIFLINFIQLLIFRKYDFAAMYCFRLAYYLVWHIGWGYFRLDWLF